MRRFQLFEWEDQPWLPTVLRDFVTDHLRYTLNEPMRGSINRAIAERLVSTLQAAGTSRIIDLCSGAGGPIVTLSRIMRDELGCSVDVVLTDLYPNSEAFSRLEKQSGGIIRSRRQPTSAMDVPDELSGVRTMFTALHHFTPDQVRVVLADAVRKRAAVAVFEPLERTWRMALLVAAMSLVRGFTHTPRVAPLTLGRFLVTYLVPIAPIVLAWDGFVSALRTYRPEELRALAGTDNVNFTWDTGCFMTDGPYGPMPTTFLVGLPREGGQKRTPLAAGQRRPRENLQ